MSAETEGLERALDVLLTAMLEEDRKLAETAGASSFKAHVFTAADLQRAARLTRLEMDVTDLQRQPVRAACRQAVRRIGEHLFKILGSTDGMREVLERAADMVPEQYGHRASIVDHAWDGIGSDSDRWLA